jgi:hypothetical protein
LSSVTDQVVFPVSVHFRLLLAAATAASLLAGCTSGSKPEPGPTVPSSEPTTTPSPCPGVALKPKLTWPAGFPANLPKPPGASAAVPVNSGIAGLRIVRFSTPTSLREGVLFIVKAVPKAGFNLGRGDAEPNEADAPFTYNGQRGTYRMASRVECETQWLVAIAKNGVNGGSPLLPTPTGSPSPLPFAP